jgi:hypothetical protein
MENISGGMDVKLKELEQELVQHPCEKFFKAHMIQGAPA